MGVGAGAGAGVVAQGEGGDKKMREAQLSNPRGRGVQSLSGFSRGHARSRR